MNVMLDIETLGLRPGSAIISIGAVGFDTRGAGSKLYMEIDWQSCEELGLTIDTATVQWWMRQEIKPPTGIIPIRAALFTLSRFVGGVTVWANSPSFDCVMLEEAYRRADMSIPWSHRELRDLRTALAAKPGFDPKSVPKVGTEHNALDDAVWQVNALLASGWFA